MTLTEFLLARIAEDEAAAKAATAGPWRWRDDPAEGLESETTRIIEGRYPALVLGASGMHTEGYVEIEPPDAAHIAHYHPARVLAECEAKRRIVAEAVYWQRDARPKSPNAEKFASWLLLELAKVYAEHPDFREEWRA